MAFGTSFPKDRLSGKNTYHRTGKKFVNKAGHRS